MNVMTHGPDRIVWLVYVFVDDASRTFERLACGRLVVKSSVGGVYNHALPSWHLVARDSFFLQVYRQSVRSNFLITPTISFRSVSIIAAKTVRPQSHGAERTGLMRDNA